MRSQDSHSSDPKCTTGYSTDQGYIRNFETARTAAYLIVYFLIAYM